MDEEKVVVEELLEEEITSIFDYMSGLDPNSKEYENGVKRLETLYKLRTEGNKAYWDAEDKQRRLDMEEKQKEHELELHKTEEALKREQLAEQKKEGFFRFVLGCAEVGLPLIFYAFWMRKGFKFEETGSYTSTTFKNLFNRFKPTRK